MFSAAKKALNIKQTYYKKGFKFNCYQISWIVQTAAQNTKQYQADLLSTAMCANKPLREWKALVWHIQTLDYMHYESKQGAKYI